MILDCLAADLPPVSVKNGLQLFVTALPSWLQVAYPFAFCELGQPANIHDSTGGIVPGS